MRAGTTLIWVGVALVVVGVLVRFGPAGLWGWFGNLPGDIRIGGERTSVLIPLTSMIIVSVVASVVLAVIRRLGQ